MTMKKDNTGFLSRNQKRESDKHPEYTGSATIDGQEMWLSAWINENENGKYFKISFKKKEPRQGGGGQSQRSSQREPGDEDDTPF